MLRVQSGPVVGLAGVAVLLAAIATGTRTGLGPGGWAVGGAVGLVGTVVLARALAVPGTRLGPAGWVTLTRAVLACGVAAMTADSLVRTVSVPLVVGLTAVALALDAVDGAVARRTGTSSAFGARFDMETDAFLILVLSVYVAPAAGAWVLAIGAARYAFVAAGRLLPWLRRPVPPRHWAKVVAAVQGLVLTVAASGVLPSAVSGAALLVALALLAESFGRDVVWLGRNRAEPDAATAAAPRPAPAVGSVLTVLAVVVVWAALVLPTPAARLTAAGFARLPVEGLLVVGLALVLPRRARWVLATGLGAVLGLLVVLAALDRGFFAVFGRPFDPVNDWVYLGPGVGVLGDSVGRDAARAVAVGAGALAVLTLVVVPLALGRVMGVTARHPREAGRVLVAGGTVWVLCLVTGIQVTSGVEVASSSAGRHVLAEVVQVRADLADRSAFAHEIAADAYAGTPDARLLSALRGKDVLVVFVESYGRVAVQGTTYAPGIDAVLDAGTTRLRAAGYAARSAFLTSPTFGAGSWLAHSTLQSGLWVDSEQRYRQLLRADRLSLTDAFGRAGWRTVLDVPANTQDWPEGQRFYHPDALYDSRDVGYRGPAFGYASMPDQYTLEAFWRRELAPRPRPPVMAEIDLVSSHHPWAPLPHLVPWDTIGDGSVFDPMPAQGQSADVVFRDPEAVRTAYGQSIEYSLEALVSFLEHHRDPHLVLVVLGDHQPHSYVSGPAPGHDVPVSVVASDPDVLARIAGWGWQDGLRPDPQAPVWRMDAFRDRFLTAYGPGGAP